MRKPKQVPMGRLLQNVHAPAPDRSIEDAEDWQILKAQIQALPPRMRLVVVAEHNGKSFAQIGRAIGVTRERVRQIHKQALDLIRLRIREAETP